MSIRSLATKISVVVDVQEDYTLHNPFLLSVSFSFYQPAERTWKKQTQTLLPLLVK